MDNNIKTEWLNNDERGNIQSLIKNSDVLRIFSRKGSKRADHVHNASGHIIFVTKGILTYFERPYLSNEIPKQIILNVGDYWETGPQIEHAMRWNHDENNEFLCFATIPRDKDSYENDLIKLNWDLEKIYNNSLNQNQEFAENKGAD